MKTKITLYRGVLIIDTDPAVKTKDFVPNTEGRFGCVLSDTKKNLGMSEEAFDAINKMPKEPDSFAPLTWFSLDKGGKAIGWRGGPTRYSFVEGMSVCRSTKAWPGEFTEIPNEPGERHVKEIDSKLSLKEA